ncbi:MAG: hypothetical protein AB1758_30460, partial [Candidatus Eremiobacterota bacterium]
RHSYLLTRLAAERARARTLAFAGAEELYSILKADPSLEARYLTRPYSRSLQGYGTFEVRLSRLNAGLLRLESRGVTSGGHADTGYLVLATGGRTTVLGVMSPDSAGRPAASVFSFDPATHRWAQIGPVPRLDGDLNALPGRLLKRIEGVAVDDNGEIYAYSVAKKTIIQYRLVNGSFVPTPLACPLKVKKEKDIGADGQYLYVYRGDTLARCRPEPDGNVTWDVYSCSFGPDQAATGPDGDLFAIGSGAVHRLDPATGQWGSLKARNKAQRTPGPDKPERLAVGPEGQVLVSDDQALWQWTEDLGWSQVPLPYKARGGGGAGSEDETADPDDADLGAGVPLPAAVPQPQSRPWPARPNYLRPGATESIAILPDNTLVAGHRGFDDEDNEAPSLWTRPYNRADWKLEPQMVLPEAYSTRNGLSPVRKPGRDIPGSIVSARTGPYTFERRSFGYVEPIRVP